MHLPFCRCSYLFDRFYEADCAPAIHYLWERFPHIAPMFFFSSQTTNYLLAILTEVIWSLSCGLSFLDGNLFRSTYRYVIKCGRRVEDISNLKTKSIMRLSSLALVFSVIGGALAQDTSLVEVKRAFDNAHVSIGQGALS